MKALGWIFIVFGVLDFVVGIIGVANGYEVGGRQVGGGIGIGALGVFLVYRAKKKKQERQEHDNWSNE